MIKTAIISLIALSGIGTSAMAVDTIKPTLELSVGTMLFSFDEKGVSTELATKPDYALRVKTQKGRVVAIRF